jgi:hypothetical protein
MTQNFNEPAVARRTGISRNNAVLRLLFLANTREAQLDCHL